MKPNGQPRPHFDRSESFGHDELSAKCYLRCSRPSNVDMIDIFDKDDQATKHCSFSLNVLRPGHLHQKF